MRRFKEEESESESSSEIDREVDFSSGSESSDVEESKADVIADLSTFEARQRHIVAAKEKIANFCAAVLEAPQDNVLGTYSFDFLLLTCCVAGPTRSSS